MAIDQGTTSTRAMVFDRSGAVISREQLEHRQIFPKAGWVEHDAAEIRGQHRRVAAAALASADLRADHIVACGLTNQRAKPLCCGTGPPANPHNAIVWQDTRTGAL